MNRRIFLKKFSMASGAALGLSSSLNAATSLKNNATQIRFGRKRPNVIYIMADDLGYGDIGCYGQQLIETPNVDKLAAEGMRFTQHYAGDTVCAPTRCVLLTGLHTGHSYIRGNYEYNSYQWPLQTWTRTVGHEFQEEGYVTGCIGKWGLGGPNTAGEPGRQGIDHFYGYLGQVQAHSYYPNHLWRSREGDATSTQAPLETGTYSHDSMTEEALWFLETYKDRPFFLYLPYTIPHTKFQVPDLGQYADKEGWSDNQKIQAAMISRMDRDIGRIMKMLKSLGLDDNTLVMFTSDNGPHGQGSTLDFFNANGPLRGKKRDMYEGGVRVPMVARWPGKVKPGAMSDHISAFWDLYPTCCDLLGVKPPKVYWSDQTEHDVDGISFLPTLLGKNSQQQQHDYLYWEFYEQNGKQAIRQGKWKLVRLNVQNYSSETEYLEDVSPSNLGLYDLEADIAESDNLVADNPAKTQELKDLIVQAHTRSPLSKFQFGWE